MMLLHSWLAHSASLGWDTAEQPKEQQAPVAAWLKALRAWQGCPEAPAHQGDAAQGFCCAQKKRAAPCCYPWADPSPHGWVGHFGCSPLFPLAFWSWHLISAVLTQIVLCLQQPPACQDDFVPSPGREAEGVAGCLLGCTFPVPLLSVQLQPRVVRVKIIPSLVARELSSYEGSWW